MSTPQNQPKKKIIIFASGSGTNAENIIKYFRDSPHIEVIAVFSNKKLAGALKRAHDLNVKALHFDRQSFYQSNEVYHVLQDLDPDLIVLAGFLWLFPMEIVEAFPNRIINIHPALLPKYGGKGMYGSYVHEAVIANNEKESGISIHYVNPEYDEGEIIFQASTQIDKSDTPDELAKKIHKLEYEHFPKVIEQILTSEK